MVHGASPSTGAPSESLSWASATYGVADSRRAATRLKRAVTTGEHEIRDAHVTFRVTFRVPDTAGATS